jgi:hypothetical protein
MVALAVLFFAGLVLGLVVAALLFLSQARAMQDRTDVRYNNRSQRWR